MKYDGNENTNKTALAVFISIQDKSYLERVSLRNVAESFLEDVTSLHHCDVHLYTDPASEDWIHEHLSEAGRFDVVTDGPQGPSKLSEKVDYAFEVLFGEGYEQVIALAADTPNLEKNHIQETMEEFRTGQQTAVVGPSTDGGFYLLGLNEYRKDLLEKVPFFSHKTLRNLLGELGESFETIVTLDELSDVDSLLDWLGVNRGLLSQDVAWILRLIINRLKWNRAEYRLNFTLPVAHLSFLTRKHRAPPSCLP